MAMASLGRERERLIARRSRHEDELASIWRLAGVAEPPGGGAGTLGSWLDRRTEVLEAQVALEQAERQGREAADDGDAVAAALRAALLRAGAAADPVDALDLLLARARNRLDTEVEARSLRAALAERQGEAAERSEAFAKAIRADAAWKEGWARTCATCWLGDDGEVPDIEAVRGTLAELAELDAVLERHDGWADRISKMERDSAVFAGEAAAVAALVGETLDGNGALALADRLAARIGASVDVAAALSRIGTTRAEAEGRQRDLAGRLDVNARRRAAMSGFFGVAGFAWVETCIAQVAERARLEAEIRTAACEILELLGLDDFAQAEATLAGIDRGSLAGERAELRGRLEDEDRRCHELFAAKSAAADRVEAVGGDARAAAIEARRRTVLLEIEDGALRYLRLRAGVAALEQALRLYKEGHRGSMLDRASEAFVTMSRRRLHRSQDAALEGSRGPHRDLARRCVQGGGPALEGHAVPALPFPTRGGLPRVRRHPNAAALRRRRHHGDLRRLPSGGGAEGLRPHGRSGTGRLPHPPPSPPADRPRGLPRRQDPRSHRTREIGGLTDTSPACACGRVVEKEVLHPPSRRSERRCRRRRDG